MSSILILPLNEAVVALPGQTVLEAAMAAGVQMASSCRNGTCRACLCQMTSGTVRYRIAWPGLSAEEKTAGAILPCVAEPLTDVVLEQVATSDVVATSSASPRDLLRQHRGF